MATEHTPHPTLAIAAAFLSATPEVEARYTPVVRKRLRDLRAATSGQYSARAALLVAAARRAGIIGDGLLARA